MAAALSGYTERHSWSTKSAAQYQAQQLKKQYKSVRVVKKTNMFNETNYTVFTKGSKR